MSLQINHEIVTSIFSDTTTLDSLIADYTQAVADHALTVDVPAPVAHPIVEQIVKNWNGQYSIVDVPEPEPEPEPEPPSKEALIIAERDRRLALGFDFDFGDNRGVHRIGTTTNDMVGWNDVTSFANALSGLGDTTTTISILTDTGVASVTAPEWLQILVAAAAVRQPIWASSFALSAMETLPSDYTDDSYWI
jgi:hypothetical protein